MKTNLLYKDNAEYIYLDSSNGTEITYQELNDGNIVLLERYEGEDEWHEYSSFNRFNDSAIAVNTLRAGDIIPLHMLLNDYTSMASPFFDYKTKYGDISDYYAPGLEIATYFNVLTDYTEDEFSKLFHEAPDEYWSLEVKIIKFCVI